MPFAVLSRMISVSFSFGTACRTPAACVSANGQNATSDPWNSSNGVSNSSDQLVSFGIRHLSGNVVHDFTGQEAGDDLEVIERALVAHLLNDARRVLLEIGFERGEEAPRQRVANAERTHPLRRAVTVMY